MKVIIIGCGNVGMSYAYSIVNHPSNVDELVLIDIDRERAIGEAMDLNHALPFAPSKTKVRAGDYDDCNDASIICIAAGRNQNEGETRLDLINKNLAVFKDILSKTNQTNFNGIYLVATNPVDIMSYVTYKLTGNSDKVIGSGTTLDTARLKYLIGQELEINPKNIHAYVLGEHGDSEMVLWSQATLGVRNLKYFLTNGQMEKIALDVKNSAYEIIKRKGNTSYGIGVCLLSITNSILSNDNAIYTVSSYNKEEDLYIATPTVMNIDGVKKQIEVDFSAEEMQEYQDSINVLKNVIENLNI